MFESALLIPMRSQNSRKAAGGSPRRRIPDSVGNRGSSQPVHVPLHELNEFAFREHRALDVESTEFNLLRLRFEESSGRCAFAIVQS